ncbi:MAG: glycosyltransferase family 2 protein [Pyrinomonadaceae bacterium]|nr:glycosyltransferase family 2 protein [Pyrinomonadaceae bacterium]
MQKYRNVHSMSVFFPAFNDQASIGPLVRNTLSVLASLTDDYEVLIVNDGSTDATPTVVDELARTLPCVKVIHHVENMGYGAALRSGFANSDKDLIFYTDGDGQYDVRELVVLHQLMTDSIDIVNGYKIKRSDQRSRKVLGAVYNQLARYLFRLPIRDVDCDFRLLRRRAIQQIKLVSSSGVICVELVRKLHAAGCVFAEAPVHHFPRAHGRSQFFTLQRVARTTLDFFFLWLRLVALQRFVAGSPRSQKMFAKDTPAAEEVRASLK